MENLFGGIYKGKKVLITGHTGFKGSWLSLWLTKMGAEVTGYSIGVPTEVNHFELLKLKVTSITDTILNKEKLIETIDSCKPDIVFHMAAQPLVRESYEEPILTLETNILGTANVLEACRMAGTVKAIVIITSDKCYQNNEQIWGFREIDPMGGDDPYSASKGAAELVSHSYRMSFFNNQQYGKTHTTLVANVRAGNVIGGGDWAKDRLIPDIIRATEQSESVKIRSPRATRPWQHVLEPLSGYLQVGARLLDGKVAYADNWNFGPSDDAIFTVAEVLAHVKKNLPAFQYSIEEDPNNPHEAHLLRLDSSKAHLELNWQNVWSGEQTFSKTINWYKEHAKGSIISEQDLDSYIEAARALKVEWTS